jgi:hypothetical protein
MTKEDEEFEDPVIHPQVSSTPNYSKHLTKEDWGDVTPSNHDVAIGLLFALFMFFAGMAFDHLFIVGMLHL